MQFKKGCYEGLSFSEYQSIRAWRSHDLMTLSKCAYTWQNQKEMQETPALLEGRVQHTVFLEHHKFFEEFAIQPDVDRRTKAGKAEYALWLEDLGDKTAIKQDMYDACMERRKVVEDFVPGADDQVELTVCFEWHGHPCKSRFDWYTGEDVWDLKTCRDASPRGFKGAINSFRYFQQAAFYLTAARSLGMTANGFWFLAQEKMHPYPFSVYTLSDEAIEYGNIKNEQALALGIDVANGAIARPFNQTKDWIEIGANELY